MLRTQTPIVDYGHPGVYIQYYDKFYTQPRKSYNIEQELNYQNVDKHREGLTKQKDDMRRYYTQYNSIRVKNTNYNKPETYNKKDYYKIIRGDLDEETDVMRPPMNDFVYRPDKVPYGKASQKRLLTMSNTERQNKIVPCGNGRVVLP